MQVRCKSRVRENGSTEPFVRGVHWSPKPRAVGSNPTAPAKLKALKLRGFKAFFVVYDVRHRV